MSSRTGKSKVTKSRSRSARAGVTFPVGRLTRHMRRLAPHARLGSGAPVYLAAVLEYLTAEVLELAGNYARSNKRSRVKPKDIKLGISTDDELHKLCRDVTFSEGGQLVDIHPSLMSTSNTSNTSKKSSVKTKVISVIKKPSKTKVKPHKNPAGRGSSSVSAPPSGGSATGTTSRAKNKLPILSEGTLFLGQKLTVVMGSITALCADALVHPTNSSYSTSGQVGSALSTVGGAQYLAELSNLQSQGNLGSCGASICNMFNAQAKKIIHCNSPSWNQASGVADLEKTVSNCLKLADKENLKSIALPSIGSGNAGWPKQLAAETILRSINRYFQSVMASSIKQVYFVLFDKESVDVYTTELTKLVDLQSAY